MQHQMSSSTNRVPEHPVLELGSVEAGYGKVDVLHGVDFSVPHGSVVALIGANGAGKSTLLKVASGFIRPRHGTVVLDGAEVTGEAPHRRAERGLCLIPEGRGVFRALTVRENLKLAVPPWLSEAGFDPALEAFPVLGGRMKQLAGTLSGGEQQMLALARAYLASPQVILVDELSLGLAPVLVDRMLESVRTLASMGTSLVIVEQYVHKVLALAESAYVLVRGRMTWSGPCSDVDDALLRSSYLGATGES